LPNWSITWPGGQLSTIGRSGKYSENVNRYNNVFNSFKRKPRSGFVHIVSIENQSRGRLLKAELHPIFADCMARSAHRGSNQTNCTNLMTSIDFAIDRMCAEDNFNTSRRRNSGRSLANSELEPSSFDIEELTKYFDSKLPDK